MKIVSQLDVRGYYIGPVQADESPLEPGVYLIPGGAVDAPPPTIPSGMAAKWNDRALAWEIVSPAELPPELFVPQVVTMRQARLALLERGLLDAVLTAIAAIPDETARKAAEIEWEYSQSVERQRPFVIQLSAAIGLTPLELDELFLFANTL